jgi:Zn-dependent peptidase ImmA (M78 family)
MTGPLPTYVDFGFHKVRVERINEKRMREEAECEEEEPTPEGLWLTDLDTIYILKTLNRASQRYYLMHEMVHAALDLMDNLDRPKRKASS